MPRKPKKKEITPAEEPPKPAKVEIPEKVQMELKALADAVRLLSSGWKQNENTFVREPSQDPAGMDWEKISPDVRALFCINLLKSFSDAAIKTQYGQKALAILREVQDQTQIETQRLLDFLAEIERNQISTEEGQAEIEEDSPPLELNGNTIIPRIEMKPYHGIERLKISTSKPAQKIRLAKSDPESNVLLPVEVLQKKKPVMVSVDIPDEMLKVSHRITHYERAVEDALGTLWANQKDPLKQPPVVTDRTVFLVMNGLPPDAEVNKESLEKVHNAIDRLSRIRGEIIFPQEIAEAFKFSPELKEAFSFEKGKNGEIKTWTLKGPIVQTDEVTATFASNGKKAKAWTLTGRAPLFFLCSSLLKQVRTIPSACMNVKYIDDAGEERTRQNTPNFIAMKHYLATQVKRIERKDEDDIKRILLKSLIEEIEELNPAKRANNPRPMTRADKKRIVEDVAVILEHFKRTHFIEGYKVKKEGNEITGFDIEPRKKRK